ncbi:PITH domain-containing protein GA19395 [Ischnura elegans]|uniref:PITH domain-containing protein GA19395 n=1 Tax=Ischnura elegans TaxID=197161 RepID=UPI001ED888C4|nr:PITH domain-containing protein GA19395 [Ischnura elegans]XP_046402359.1 PITH domain-containing protein GA19395 [Ischnura elegans]
MSGHNHGHGHSCAGDHDHDDTPEMGFQYSLYQKIDRENMECLNESVEGAGKEVFKTWEDRLNVEKIVESDVDEELLFNIPFTGNIKLKGIIVAGSDDETHPSKIRLFKNRPHMTFDDARIKADQEFDLHRDAQAVLEYATKVVTFSSVYHLTLHFPSNFGSETTRIIYIGLRGEWTEAHHHGVTICTYEARPSVADHKADVNPDSLSHEII